MVKLLSRQNDAIRYRLGPENVGESVDSARLAGADSERMAPSDAK